MMAKLKITQVRSKIGGNRKQHAALASLGLGRIGKSVIRDDRPDKARSTVPAGFEGGQMPLIRRIPKLKGFSNAKFKTVYQVVNLDKLSKLYPEGGEVTIEDLVAKGAVRKNQPVKVLGTGEISVPVRVSANAFSSSAKEKILAAGGSVTEI